MRALIVEDLPESETMLVEVAALACSGVAGMCVANVHGALQRCASERFDLALIDLSLPDGPCNEVIRKLAHDDPQCTLVMATIFDDDEHLFPAVRAGAHGYLLEDDPLELLAQQPQVIPEARPPLPPSVARRMP